MQPSDKSVVDSMLAELEEEEDNSGSSAHAQTGSALAENESYNALSSVRRTGGTEHQAARGVRAGSSSSANNARGRTRGSRAMNYPSGEESSEDDRERELEKFDQKKAVAAEDENTQPTKSFGKNTKRSREEAESLRNFIHQPGKSTMTQCRIVRKRSFFGNPEFYVYLDSDNQYLMCGKKRRKAVTPYYLVTLDNETGDRDNPLNLGKVRANWVGSAYSIYDQGMNPEDTVLSSSVRKELGFIRFYECEAGPGTMDVFIPMVSQAGIPTTFQPAKPEETIMHKVDEGDTGKLFRLKTKHPEYDEKQQTSVLYFGGRVTKRSTKNFQLRWEDQNEILLQFGRRDERDEFIMDYKYPLSAFQAFCIVLTALDPKVMDARGYKNVKKL